jgi:hypothetical protein
MICPVDHRRDSGLGRSEEPDQSGGIDVVGLDVFVDAGVGDLRVVKEGLPSVAMGIDEPWHNDGVASFDLLSITSPEAGSHLDDAVAFDEDVGV